MLTRPSPNTQHTKTGLHTASAREQEGDESKGMAELARENGVFLHEERSTAAAMDASKSREGQRHGQRQAYTLVRGRLLSEKPASGPVVAGCERS